MKAQRPFRTLIFDLDGTLVNTIGDITHSLNLTLREYGFPPINETRCTEYVGHGIANLIRTAFRTAAAAKRNHSLSEDQISEYLQRYLQIYGDHYLDHSAPYPGVVDTLAQLQDFQMAVVSNKSYSFTSQVIKHTKLEQYFRIVLGGDSLPHKKPAPEPLLYVLEKLGGSPMETLMIGDGDTDMQAAKAAGIRCCAVSYGYRPKQQLLEYRPDFIIDDFRQLVPIVLT